MPHASPTDAFQDISSYSKGGLEAQPSQDFAQAPRKDRKTARVRVGWVAQSSRHEAVGGMRMGVSTRSPRQKAESILVGSSRDPPSCRC